MLKISDVLPESAAAKAGLIADDVIVGMNGEGLTSTEDFLETVSKVKETPIIANRTKSGGSKKPDMKELSLLPKPDSTGGYGWGFITHRWVLSPVLCRKHFINPGNRA